MTIKKSKPYAIEGITFAGGKVNYDFQNNKLIGIKGLNSNNVFQPIPRTDPDFQKSISGDALSSVRRAYNIVKHGEDKQAYEDTFQISSDEEIDARYDQSYQSFLNAGFVDNNFDKPKPFAYTTQRKGSDSRSSSEVMAYPIDISTEQDHFKITKFKYQRNNINQSKPASKETNIAGDSVKGSQIKGSILLPMPKATDVNGVEWGNSDLTVTGLAALGAAEKAAEAGGAVLDAMNPFSDKGFGVKRMLNGGDVQGNTLFKNEEQRKASQEFKRNGQGRKGPTGSDVMAAGQAMAIQSITNTAASAFGTQIDADVALGRTGGRVLNPNAEMLFQGPVIRDFTFSFIN